MRGQIIQVEAGQDDMKHPNSFYVADFIGRCEHHLPALLKAAGDEMYHLDWVANEAPLLAASDRTFMAKPASPSRIRPEKIAIFGR